MSKWNWRRHKGPAAMAAAISITAVSILGYVSYAGAAIEPEQYQFEVPALSGEDSQLLQQNPDRGLRMEVYMDVATGRSVFEHSEEDAIAQLEDEIALYQSDQPKLIQVYFYLTGYKDRDLDAEAFARMNQYFEELKKHNLKALLRFAYISDDTKPTAQEPSTDQVVRHIGQLKDFIDGHQEQITVFQMGYIGAWGEWDSGARSRMEEKRIVDAVLKNTPETMYIQVRYLNIKNNNMDPEDTVNWNRVGYHDDFLIGNLHGWNTAGDNPQSSGYQQMSRESAHLLVDGEMIWGSANDYYVGGSIDATLMAKRMKEHHFTSLSMTHNYKEHRQAFSMSDWQEEYINQAILEQNELQYEENWFLDREGNNLPRTMFDYLRDHLGYYLTIKDASAKVSGSQVDAGITIENYGFAAPLGLKDFRIVLLDAQGKEAASQEGCSMDELQPEKEKIVHAELKKPKEDRIYQLAVIFCGDAGEPVRLANEVTYENGYHILGEV